MKLSICQTERLISVISFADLEQPASREILVANVTDSNPKRHSFNVRREHEVHAVQVKGPSESECVA